EALQHTRRPELERRTRGRQRRATEPGEELVMEAVSEDGLKVARLDPEPSPWRALTRATAAVSALGSIYNPNPDDPNEPHGPGTPVIRDIATALAVFQISFLIADGAA